MDRSAHDYACTLEGEHAGRAESLRRQAQKLRQEAAAIERQAEWEDERAQWARMAADALATLEHPQEDR